MREAPAGAFAILGLVPCGHRPGRKKLRILHYPRNNHVGNCQGPEQYFQNTLRRPLRTERYRAPPGRGRYPESANHHADPGRASSTSVPSWRAVTGLRSSSEAAFRLLPKGSLAVAPAQTAG